MKLSIVVPAKDEEHSIGPCLSGLRRTIVDEHHITAEIIVVDDASTDRTAAVVREAMERDASIRLVSRTAPSGFGRAVRAGLAHVTGDVVVICMADGSDAPEDVVRYVRKIEEGNDCVFGSRFMPSARVDDYPFVKLVLNRLANRGIQLLFRTPFNDLTNAFKAYRADVLRSCGPFTANHFDLTLEIALAAVAGPYKIAQVPVDWKGRTAGQSKLQLPRMSLRYLAVVATSFLGSLRKTRVNATALRWCLYAVITIGLIRALAYLLYVSWHFSFALETHALEATMVHHAWRVLSGASLYPAWQTYPHVTNFFAPAYFWVVGWLGQAMDASIPDLFVIGRSVSLLSTLGATAALAAFLWKRYGTSAALIGAMASVGLAPLYGFSIMTRPDAMADTLGLAGLLLTALGTGRSMVVGGALLVLAIVTKQTAAIYLLSSVVMCAAQMRHRHAMLLAAASAFALVIITVAMTTMVAPLFLLSIFQEGHSPLSPSAWMRTTTRLVTWSPELPILSIAGLLLWWRQKDHGMLMAMATLAAASLFSALKVGSDLNYLLPLRVTAVLAAGGLWAAGRQAFQRRDPLVAAAVAGVALMLVPSTLQAVATAAQARNVSLFMQSPAGARALQAYAELIRLVQTPDVRVLTDSGILALYQTDRAPFVDPWLFRLLVHTNRIEPRHMESLLESGSYEFLVLTADLHASTYDAYEFGLPLPLVRKARDRYTQVAYTAGLFVYRRRDAS